MFEFDRRPKEEAHATTRGERLFLFGFCALFVLAMLGEVFNEFSPNRLSFFFFLLFWCLLTIAHEAGHALVANFLGWRVDEVRLGFGPVLGRFNVMGLPVEMRAFPIVGLVQVVPQSLEYAKFKNMLIYAAGPGVELGLAWLVGASIGWDVVFLPNESLLVIAGQSLMVAAVLGAGLNLLPGEVTRLENGVVHIGWNNLNLLSHDNFFHPFEDCDFYFNHSYVLNTKPDFVIATTRFSKTIPSIVRSGSVVGLQFHPEKSQKDGLALLGKTMEVLIA